MLRDCKRVNNADVTDTYLKMARIGYARVSTTDQDLTTQLKRLKAAGCEIIRSEKVTGTTRQGRAELASIIEFLRRGRRIGGDPDRPVSPLNRRPAGHRTGAQAQGCLLASRRPAHRHQHGGT